MRLDQCQFFYWDPRIDPREPEYELSQPPGPGGFFLCIIGLSKQITHV